MASNELTVNDTDSDDLAIQLYDKLSESIVIDIPDINLDDPRYDLGDTNNDPIYGDFDKLTNDDLTTRTIGGTGTFDALMTAYTAHLTQEYNKGRITGAEYSRAYIELTATAMSQSVQYLLGRDQAYWSAIMTQQQAKNAKIAGITALVQLAMAKTELGITGIRAEMGKAEFALSKLRLSSEDANYQNLRLNHDVETFKLETILPTEAINIGKQGQILDEQVLQLRATTTGMIPKQIEMLDAQISQVGKQSELVDEQIRGMAFNTDNMLPAQLISLNKENELIDTRILIAKSEKAKIDYDVNNLMPAQVAQVVSQSDMSAQQIKALKVDIEEKTFNIHHLLPKQRDMLIAQTQGVLTSNAKLVAEKETVLYNVRTLMPAQLAQMTAQTANTTADTTIKTYTHTSILPAQLTQTTTQTANISAQTLNVTADTAIKSYTNTQMLPAQKKLVDEQTEAKRAETLNNRSDGAAVTGSIGKQKDLYTQQIDSYIRDSEYKIAKMFSDAWITQKSIDEGTTPPTIYTSTNINTVLTQAKTRAGL